MADCGSLVDTQVCPPSSAQRKLTNENLIKLFKTLQSVLRPQVCLEMGAYEASFSVFMAKTYPGTLCYAFEANPHNHASFHDRVARECPQVKYMLLAVADRTGHVKFSLQDRVKSTNADVSRVRGNNSIVQRNDARLTYTEVTVPSTTWDDFVAAHSLQKPTCVWIDVEGAQRLILPRGARSLEHVQTILIEVETHSYWKDQWLQADVLSFLNSHGFTCVARDFEFPKQFNYVFVKNSLLPRVDEVIKQWHAAQPQSY